MRSWLIKKIIAFASLLLVLLPVVAAPAVSAQDSITDLLTPFYSANSTDCVGGGSVYKFVQALAYLESTDNPTAHNGDASGKYQYITTTWQSHSASYYPPAAKQFATAADAPEGVQDTVAFIEYSVKAVQFGGDLQKMAVSHIYPDVANDPSKWPSTKIGSNPTAQEYADKFIQFYDSGKGQNDPLKFDSVPDFDKYYTSSVGHPYAPTSGSLVSNCGGGVPSGNFVFYNQGDFKWSSHGIYTGNTCGNPPLPDTIGCAGCGPTSVAMVVATLADNTITPDKVGDYMTSLGSGVGYSGAGATTAGLEKAIENWGLKPTSLSTADFSSAIQILKSGGLVIAGGAGQSPFSASGHVVVIRGIDSSGNFLIGNPAPNLQASQDQGFSSSQLQAAGLMYMIGVTK